MVLDFFQNTIDSKMTQHPNDMYRDLEQAFVNQQWENTTARYTIEEQNIDSNGQFIDFAFTEVEAWVNYVVGQTSTGLKNGDDFRQLTFRDLGHKCIRGRYYKMDNNYWIGDFTDEYDSIVTSMTIRRCNNFMRIIDPQDGSVYSAPCVIGYEMSSPSSQVSRYIITPNNHATVMVQGNADTLRLFKLNTRYIFGGRPFKLCGFQNAILDDLDTPTPTLLYLDLYLDEEHADDDLENQIADNGQYDYSIDILSDNMNLVKGANGKLEANILLNGVEVSREIAWGTSDGAVVSIDANGNYEVLGDVGQSVMITSSLATNPNVLDTITINIVDVADIQPTIVITPDFDKIRQHETQMFYISAIYNGKEYTDIDSSVSLNDTQQILQNDMVTIVKEGNAYHLTCSQFSSQPINLYLSISSATLAFETTETKEIKLVSMLG